MCPCLKAGYVAKPRDRPGKPARPPSEIRLESEGSDRNDRNASRFCLWTAPRRRAVPAASRPSGPAPAVGAAMVGSSKMMLCLSALVGATTGGGRGGRRDVGSEGKERTPRWRGYKHVSAEAGGFMLSTCWCAPFTEIFLGQYMSAFCGLDNSDLGAGDTAAWRDWIEKSSAAQISDGQLGRELR
jgi:hypothetical protein